MYRNCPSSFHGEIVEIPGIAVDNFTGDNVYARAFFISHYHGDHVQGLGSNNLLNHLRKTNTYIYTSLITAAIINFESKCPELLKYIKPLDRDSNLITLPSRPEKGWEELFVEVTLIPAGHSFGSTMFLFKMPKKTILYTGDFRIRINDIAKYSKLHQSDGDPIQIDAMYVDTTFIKDDFEDFAKRSDTADAVIDEIDEWLKQGENNAVSIFMYANYTFEFLFNKIYQRLKTKVYVGKENWRLYSMIQEQVPGITNDVNETRIHRCRHKYGDNRHSSCLPRNTYGTNYLHVHLTATRWQNYNLDQAPVSYTRSNFFNGLFSTHCSRNEVTTFVNHFSPLKVVGFPLDYVPNGATSGVDEEFLLLPKGKRSTTKKRKETVIKDNLNSVVKKILK